MATWGFLLFYIALDKRGIHIVFFLFLYENIRCWYSLEAPRRGASNEYHNIFFVKKKEKGKYQYVVLKKKTKQKKNKKKQQQQQQQKQQPYLGSM